MITKINNDESLFYTNEELAQWIDTEYIEASASLETIKALVIAWQLNIDLNLLQSKREAEESIEILIKQYWGYEAKAIFDDTEKTVKLLGSHSRQVILK